MFGMFKKNHITLPYEVQLNGDSIIIEASGNYNESFLVFHGVIKVKNNNLEKIYVRLNENITKEINLSIEYRDYNKFDFDFSGLLIDEDIKTIRVIDKEVLKEGSI